MEFRQISATTRADYNELITLWESSVLATHHFLSEVDINHYKSLIYNQYFNQLILYCIRDKNEIQGFIGLQDVNIQMLFVLPKHIGKGLGKALIEYALRERGARTVDVNEQNSSALRFYERIGFVVTDRSESDAAGKPFPVLSLTYY